MVNGREETTRRITSQHNMFIFLLFMNKIMMVTVLLSQYEGYSDTVFPSEFLQVLHDVHILDSVFKDGRRPAVDYAPAGYPSVLLLSLSTLLLVLQNMVLCCCASLHRPHRYHFRNHI